MCDYPQCQFNFIPGEEHALVKKCGACGAASYCGKDCQHAHWPSHKLVCKRPRAQARQGSQSVSALEGYLSPRDQILFVLHNTRIPFHRRFTLRTMLDDEVDTRTAMQFSQTLNVEHLVQFSIEKFLDTGDKGAVVFNIRDLHRERPASHSPMWFERRLFVELADPVLATQVTRYDPERAAVVFFMLPAADMCSTQVWSLEPAFSIEPLVSREVAEIHRAWATRRRAERAQRDPPDTNLDPGKRQDGLELAWVPDVHSHEFV